MIEVAFALFLVFIGASCIGLLFHLAREDYLRGKSLTPEESMWAREIKSALSRLPVFDYAFHARLPESVLVDLVSQEIVAERDRVRAESVAAVGADHNQHNYARLRE